MTVEAKHERTAALLATPRGNQRATARDCRPNATVSLQGFQRAAAWVSARQHRRRRARSGGSRRLKERGRRRRVGSDFLQCKDAHGRPWHLRVRRKDDLSDPATGRGKERAPPPPCADAPLHAGCALPPRPPHPRSAAAARTHAPPFQEPAVAPAAAPAASVASAPAAAPPPLLLYLSFVLGVGARGGPIPNL